MRSDVSSTNTPAEWVTCSACGSKFVGGLDGHSCSSTTRLPVGYATLTCPCGLGLVGERGFVQATLKAHDCPSRPAKRWYEVVGAAVSTVAGWALLAFVIWSVTR